jgi:transcriptional adapter 3
MAPSVSSKGKAKPGSKPSTAPRSRNTTPLPPVRSSVEPSSSAPYFKHALGTFLRKCDTTVEKILDGGDGGTSVPPGTRLVAMRERIESIVLKNIETRCTHSEGALRELQGLRKNRAPQREREKDPEDRERKHKVKKVKKHDEDGKHPPTTGAHGVTRQDGLDVKKGMLPQLTHVCLAIHIHCLSGPTTLVAYSAKPHQHHRHHQ